MTAFAEGYIDVAERIREFNEKHPEGTLQSFMPPYLLEAAGKVFVVYSAAAYRTPDDPRPGIGWAWEPVPGPTQFTRDSELMNAETSAWGRAIVALGFPTKKIASSNEVRNRQGTYTPDPRNTAVRDTSGDDPGQAVIFFKAHRGETIQQVWDNAPEEERKNGKTYINWIAHKLEPTSEDGVALQEQAKRFLAELDSEQLPAEWAAVNEADEIPF